MYVRMCVCAYVCMIDVCMVCILLWVERESSTWEYIPYVCCCMVVCCLNLGVHPLCVLLYGSMLPHPGGTSLMCVDVW
jgi:hypothetical protein